MTVALIYEDFRAYPTPIIYVILSAQKKAIVSCLSRTAKAKRSQKRPRRLRVLQMEARTAEWKTEAERRITWEIKVRKQASQYWE
jgi:hypothetical protein